MGKITHTRNFLRKKVSTKKKEKNSRYTIKMSEQMERDLAALKIFSPYDYAKIMEAMEELKKNPKKGKKFGKTAEGQDLYYMDI